MTQSALQVARLDCWQINLIALGEVVLALLVLWEAGRLIARRSGSAATA